MVFLEIRLPGESLEMCKLSTDRNQKQKQTTYDILNRLQFDRLVKQTSGLEALLLLYGG